MENNNVSKIKNKQCKKCKEQIHRDAKVCPYCRAKQGIPTWLLIVIIIFGLIVIFGGSGEETVENNASQKLENIEYIKVSKDELDKALEENAASAKENYNNKYVEVTGKLDTIDSDLDYISITSLKDEWDFSGIHCSIQNEEQEEIVKKLTSGQKIIIRGKITDVGEFLGYYLDITEIITE